jgi:5'(3')-deoxyribonucleotidase
MDGVLADFDRLKHELGVEGEQLKHMPGTFLRLEPMPGAIEGVRSLIGIGFECWVATKPPTGAAQAYADKVTWILRYLPELKRRIVITHDKGMLGDEGDTLIDDRPHKANCEQFRGRLIHFGNGVDWDSVLAILRACQPGGNRG